MTRVIVGIDPDTKATGIARIVEHMGQVSSLAFMVARASGRFAMSRMTEMADHIRDHVRSANADLMVIEFQHIRPRDPRPNDIMAIQAVAGAALMAARPILALTPLPREWKGSVPKAAHQPRIIKAAARAGVTWFKSIIDLVPVADQTHCIDALGLALWGAGIRI